MKILQHNKFSYKPIIKLSLIIAILALLLFTSLCAFMYFNQDSIIFLPKPIDEKLLTQQKNKVKNIEDISIKTSDGFKINGWLVKTQKIEKTPLVIYFGGNAEEVSHMINYADNFNGWAVGLINYRGYGSSEGKPGEQAFFNDAIQIYDYFIQRNDIDNKKIVVMGRSIGTGVAVYLAENRSVEGVILATPYDNFLNITKEIYPYLPVGLLLKHKFNSISRAPSIKQPMLALVAENDEVIPPIHAKRLAEKWGGRVVYKIIKGEGHNSISSNDLYWESIREFLKQI